MQFDEIQHRSRELFRLEASDLLRDLESALLELESDPANTNQINRVFRVMHTLKGSGATSGFPELSQFLHRVEDAYNAAREGRLQINSSIIDLTLKLADTVARYLAAPPAKAAAVLEADKPTLDQLLAHLPAPAVAAVPPVPSAAPTPVAVPAAQSYRIDFRPQRDLFRNGSDPGMFLDDLRTLGPCQVRGRTGEIPDLPEIDPEACYLSWEIDLETIATEPSIREVFMFIEGECALTIARRGTAVPAVEPPAPVLGWLIDFQSGVTTFAAPGAFEAFWRDLGQIGRFRILSAPATGPDTPAAGCWQVELTTTADPETCRGAFIFLPDLKPTLRPLVAVVPSATPRPEPPAAPKPAPATATPASGKEARTSGEMLRVSAERVDRLVNLVGELVILRSQVNTACARAAQMPEGLAGAAEALQSLSTELRDVVLNIRMMPIEQTFGKFRRLVRDLARDLGKEVDLVVEGAETEMDKTVLDALADPLMHLVRNSLDHGLETAAEREQAGKPRRGQVRLRAEQRGDRVVVSVGDDGRGLDPEKIRLKAVRQGLLAADARPGVAELFQLVFLPGFSTAEKLSQVSGRGVGLDVVRKQTEALRGKVDVRSELGHGAEFQLSLPLTLAIIEGLMVEIDGERYILPLSAARETIELTRAQRAADNGRNVVALRGELVPYLDLRALFGCTSPPPGVERVVVVEIEEQRVGLVVDRVIGNYQTVLKSLGRMLRGVTIFSGATVLGDGRIALILDIPQLLVSQRQLTGASRGFAV